MVAYGFKERFVAPIQDNLKRQTIRKPRRGRSRHARPGDDLQIYTAMRTKYCTLIGRSVCLSADPITLDLAAGKATITHLGVVGGVTTIWPSDMDEFARSDGFEDWAEMRAFWAKEHRGITVFDGILIKWGGFRLPAAKEPANGR